MRRYLAVAGFLLAALVVWKVSFLRTLFGGGPAAPSYPSLRVGRSTLVESTVAIGTVKPKVGAEVKVGSQLSGVVGELRVNVGDTVTKGEVLATLRDADWRARLEVLRAQLTSASAEA